MGTALKPGGIVDTGGAGLRAVQRDDAAGQVAPPNPTPARLGDPVDQPGWSGQARIDSARYS